MEQWSNGAESSARLGGDLDAQTKSKVAAVASKTRQHRRRRNLVQAPKFNRTQLHELTSTPWHFS
jgi:hypothetical protein